MPNRWRDWFSQAERDLDQARDSQAAGRHEWACFAAQQSAEKALKAVHLKLGQEAWGHVVRVLIEQLPESVAVPAGFMDKARVLDGFYVPTRYANGHADGAPWQHFGQLQSSQAIDYAGEILEFCRAALAGA